MGSLLFALFEQDDQTITKISRDLQPAKSTMTGMIASDRYKNQGFHLRSAGRRTMKFDLTRVDVRLPEACTSQPDGTFSAPHPSRPRHG